MRRRRCTRRLWTPVPVAVAVPPPRPPSTAFDPLTDRRASPGEECDVCRDTPYSFPLDLPSSSCEHPVRTCRRCVERTIKEKLSTGNVTNGVRCPTGGCPSTIVHQDVRRWTRGSPEKEHIFEKPVQFVRRTDRMLNLSLLLQIRRRLGAFSAGRRPGIRMVYEPVLQVWSTPPRRE